MTELEQLRKELNELRERVAVLEQRHPKTIVGTPPLQPWHDNRWRDGFYGYSCTTTTPADSQ